MDERFYVTACIAVVSSCHHQSTSRNSENAHDLALSTQSKRPFPPGVVSNYSIISGFYHGAMSSLVCETHGNILGPINTKNLYTTAVVADVTCINFSFPCRRRNPSYCHDHYRRRCRSLSSNDFSRTYFSMYLER